MPGLGVAYDPHALGPPDYQSVTLVCLLAEGFEAGPKAYPHNGPQVSLFVKALSG